VFVFGSLLSQRRFATADFDIATLNNPSPLTNLRTAVTVEQCVFDAGLTRLGVGAAELGRTLAVFSMTIERALRLIAGAFVVASVLLGIYVNPNFLWFTVFVGLNLFQSAFTNWCPMMAILRKGGLRT
jgi:hypothetical protein